MKKSPFEIRLMKSKDFEKLNVTCLIVAKPDFYRRPVSESHIDGMRVYQDLGAVFENSESGPWLE
jgi:hypothetical protein